MRILFDLNVLLDVACRWERFPESLELFNRVVRSAEHEGGFPACGFTTLYYVLCQEIPEASARAFLKRFQETLRSFLQPIESGHLTGGIATAPSARTWPSPERCARSATAR